MCTISIRFYEELNDFLPLSMRKIECSHAITGKVSVKDVIESFGVPHTEVDLILVNQRSVDFSYLLQPNDRISVYPMFETFDISSITRIRPAPLRQTKFVLDVHLGKLAVYLRFAGFDTLYRNDYDDRELAQISVAEQRILLTRDRNLLKRRMITHGYCVRESNPKRQIAEIFRRFQLSLPAPFSQRCPKCNTPLIAMAKASILHRLLPHTREAYDEFSYCRGCDTIYWQGSHFKSMAAYLEEII